MKPVFKLRRKLFWVSYKFELIAGLAAIIFAVILYQASIYASGGFIFGVLFLFGVMKFIQRIKKKKLEGALKKAEAKQIDIAEATAKPVHTSVYTKTYTSFSGADIRVYFTNKAKNGKKQNGKCCINVQAISWRQRFGVLPANTASVCGSIIFNFYDGQFLKPFLETAKKYKDNVITVVAADEAGQTTIIEITGVEFIDWNIGMGLDDIVFEYHTKFYAKAINVYPAGDEKGMNIYKEFSERKTYKIGG